MPCRGIRAFKSASRAGAVLVILACTVAVATLPARAQAPAATLAVLLDRAQIEDMLVGYYELFGAAHPDFGSYYLEDGILDVNGIVKQGRKSIDELYKSIPPEKGKIHLLVTNLKIVVEADSASAELVWTEVLSETHLATPHILEQGREQDQLVKRSGRWYFKQRVVTNDGGLPPSLEKTYKVR
jgi:hypothetical protein